MAGLGKPKTGGRKAGTPNKITKALREATLATFEHVGGREYLAKVAREDPRTFCSLLVRMVPEAVKAELEGVAVLALLDAGPRVETGQDGAPLPERQPLPPGGRLEVPL